jgi:pimeloyl-ACP methyl ester carboxylesterase
MSIFMKSRYVMMKLYSSTINKGGIPVIFLHGNSLDLTIFITNNNIIQKFSFSPIMIDLPGHGKSPGLKEYSSVSMVDSICLFINAYFDENYYIVAHSLSGHLVINGLNRFKRLKGLILCGTPPLANLSRIEKAFNPELSQLLFNPEWTDSDLDELSNMLSCNNPDSIKRALLLTDKHFKDDFLKPSFLEGFKNEIGILNNTQIPVSISYARNDSFIRMNYMTSLKNYINSDLVSFHEFSFGGHLPFLDNPSEFYQFVSDFVRD